MNRLNCNIYHKQAQSKQTGEKQTTSYYRDILPFGIYGSSAIKILKPERELQQR
jgi:hypothetical protein